MIDCTLRRLSLLVVLAGGASAQRAWIVDVQSRPGTDFTDLPAAVAAAGEGDALHVRASNSAGYNGFTTSKGLSVLGEWGAILLSSSPIVVENLPAGRVAVIKGLSWISLDPSPVIVRNCQGRVHLDRLATSWATATAFIRIESSAAVSLSGCNVRGGPAVQVADSTVSFADCALYGANGGPLGAPGLPALEVQRSSVGFARGLAQGGNGLRYLFALAPPAPAVVSRDSALTVAGDAATVLRAGVPVEMGGVSVVQGTGGTLRIDPHVVLETYLGAPTISGTIVVTAEWLPALWARGASPGQIVRADLFSAPGDIALFLTSPAALPLTVSPGMDLWIDPFLFFVTGVALVDPSGHAAHDLALHPDPNLSFGAWTLQAVGGTFAGGFKLSNPVTYALH